jgi:hypothetical protein
MQIIQSLETLVRRAESIVAGSAVRALADFNELGRRDCDVGKGVRRTGRGRVGLLLYLNVLAEQSTSQLPAVIGL